MPYQDAEERREAKHRSYLRHKQHIIASNRQRRRDQRLFIDSLKADRPCIDCGQLFPPFVMDFDHVRGKKKYAITRLSRITVSRETILAEIAKCELVCANCHRIRSYSRQFDSHESASEIGS